MSHAARGDSCGACRRLRGREKGPREFRKMSTENTDRKKCTFLSAYIYIYTITRTYYNTGTVETKRVRAVIRWTNVYARVWRKMIRSCGKRPFAGDACDCVWASVSVSVRGARGIMSKWWLHKKLNLRRPFVSPGSRHRAPPPPPSLHRRDQSITVFRVRTVLVNRRHLTAVGISEPSNQHHNIMRYVCAVCRVGKNVHADSPRVYYGCWTIIVTVPKSTWT